MKGKKSLCGEFCNYYCQKFVVIVFLQKLGDFRSGNLTSCRANLVPRVSHLAAWGERGETLVGSSHVLP